MFIEVAPGVTVCEDNPKNWAYFNKLKRKLLESPGASKWSKQLSEENKRLRALRSYLPGHEPDR